MNDQNIEKKNISFAESGPVSVILSSDEGAAGKTTTALQLVTAFALAEQPLDLFQMDSKRKLAMKSGVTVASLLVPEHRESRGEDLVPSDLIAPWYRAVTDMPQSKRSVLLEVGGALAPLFHAGITDLDLDEDITSLGLQVLALVVCKAGEDSASQMLRELKRIERNLPNATTVVVLNYYAGDPIEAIRYVDGDTRKAFLGATKRYPVIKMPRVRPRSMAIFERLQALPSTVVSWHVDNYAEAIRRTGRPRDEAKILVKDIAEWSGIMQDEIVRILPFLSGARDG
ncbi:hypothetical protein G8O24_21965 [Bradyrhizobium sp. INPA01-394B]|jgi:hypothetical protein|uniref:ParA family protein n=3 Tax=Pseudomonadota TaxID=1224 RepID=A0ABR7U046_9BRAD|nr:MULTISPECIES: hypothetical protein [Bradyrhizobium]MBC9880004.1 hypothetical protein [Bradyrhizobium campsiandrae]MBC9977364.1 hypothetical protein [Bradyrhizobium campsiandrae]MBR1090551.1 hypothetical protein [Bradyrhizobium manausense]MDU0957838.1 hypothetical protein [Bradyrhizobium sp.]MDU1491315.1 hypothetical protein [Bradyrhizobium sp.]